MPDEFPDLPNEMWQKIIPHLPPSDLQAMRATSTVLKGNVDYYIKSLVDTDALTDTQDKSLAGFDSAAVLALWADGQALRQPDPNGTLPPDYTDERLRYDEILSNTFNHDGTRANLMDGFYNMTDNLMDRDPLQMMVARDKVQDYIDWLVSQHRLLDRENQPLAGPITNYQGLIDSWGQGVYHWIP